MNFEIQGQNVPLPSSTDFASLQDYLLHVKKICNDKLTEIIENHPDRNPQVSSKKQKTMSYEEENEGEVDDAEDDE